MVLYITALGILIMGTILRHRTNVVFGQLKSQTYRSLRRNLLNIEDLFGIDYESF